MNTTRTASQAVTSGASKALTGTSADHGLAPIEGLGSTGQAALLLASLAGRCEQWALVEATAAVVQRPSDVKVLDRLVALELAVVDQGWVHVPRDDVRRAVASSALPSQVQQAHRVLAGLASTDATSRGWHLTHAATAPGQEAADLALVTARSLQSKGRPARARVMLERSARLALSPRDRAARLVEAAATQFALGLPIEANQLIDAADDAGMDAASASLAEVVRAAFTTGEAPRCVDGGSLETILDTLRGCALGPVAFAVLIAYAGPTVTPGIGEMAEPAWLSGAAKQSLAALRRGDPSAATRHLRQLGDELAAQGLRGVETHVRALLADSAARAGDLVTAAQQSRQATELAWATAQPEWRTRASVTGALVAAQRGEPEATRLVAQVHRTVLCEDGEARLLVELAHGVSTTAAEQWADGLRILMDVTGRVAECPALLDFGLLGHIAEAAVHTGRQDEARQVVSRVAEQSPVCERGSALVDLLYATALLAPETDSEACFEVVQSLNDASWPWVRARSDLARGTLLRRRRRITEARTHLLSAQRLFRAIESPVWERRTREELRAAGWRDPGSDQARDTGGWTRMSPQEQEIVRLAADGLTNRQIGERMFLSPRTIGAHLYHAFPKLGVTSRTQLARLELPC